MKPVHWLVFVLLFFGLGKAGSDDTTQVLPNAVSIISLTGVM